MKKLKYLLSIQYFAEGSSSGSNASGAAAGEENSSVNQNSTGGSSTTIDYDKIAEIVSKRSSTAEDSVLKGYFKQQGLNEIQMNEAIANYKQAQVDKANAEAQRISNLEKENQTMKAQLLNGEIDKKVTELTNGVDSAKIPFLLKLIDRSGLTNEKGEILEEKVKGAVEAVLKAFPDFSKKTGASSGFQPIGSNGGSGAGNRTEIDAALDAVFGVKSK